MAIVLEIVLRGNLINPFLEGNLLQIITIAAAVGVGTMAIFDKAKGAMVEGARVAVRMTDYGMGLFLRMLAWTMVLVPFATFGFRSFTGIPASASSRNLMI